MDLSAFLPSARGVLVPIEGWDPRLGEQYEHQAFVPHPLPSPALLSAVTYELIDKATSAVARLDQAVNSLPNPKLLNRPAIRREAQSTSALEGTFVAFTDVLEADFAEAGASPRPASYRPHLTTSCLTASTPSWTGSTRPQVRCFFGLPLRTTSSKRCTLSPTATDE